MGGRAAQQRVSIRQLQSTLPQIFATAITQYLGLVRDTTQHDIQTKYSA